ncbi:hypothetical protein FQA47_021174 [Oryzias melastigma]|uniref:Uncharacterized protein n=1 Tax=Oryzias melastigma TaxID=30732 RepID=A0A834C4W2_ORYME|nr:hypothetical protein FQA47_021174 [Oryzias melastigma]
MSRPLCADPTGPPSWNVRPSARAERTSAHFPSHLVGAIQVDPGERFSHTDFESRFRGDSAAGGMGTALLHRSEKSQLEGCFRNAPRAWRTLVGEGGTLGEPARTSGGLSTAVRGGESGSTVPDYCLS